MLLLLCEGMSIRAVTRVAGASKSTVTKLLIDAAAPKPGPRGPYRKSHKTANAA